MSDHEQRTQREPEVGTTVHLCLVGAGVQMMCQPAIIVKVQAPHELHPHAAPGIHHTHLAVFAPDGRRVVFSGIPYEPLAAGDITGTWHYKGEHEHTPVCGDQCIIPFTVGDSGQQEQEG